MKEMEKYGIDIGRVIIGPVLDGVKDTNFLGTTLEEALKTPPASKAFEVIRELNARGEVWLVSKCGTSVQKKTLAWLEHHGFEAKTGVKPTRVRFCLHRHEKAPIARTLGLTTFIDDRLDVLEHMRGIVKRLVWFGEDTDSGTEWAVPARDWDVVRGLLV